MAKPNVNYNAVITNDGNPFNDPKGTGIVDSETDENEETPPSGIVIHVVPDTKVRWNHIEDLDSFFTRMYHYHQKHGFNVMMLQAVFELIQFIFVVTFTTYILHCVDYAMLFGEEELPDHRTKVTVNDVMIPTSQCVKSLGGFTWFALFLSAIFWFFRLLRVVYHFVQFWDIKKFYNSALKIDDCELDNLTWHDIQRKIREVQSEQQMCIHKEQLTELDIYHRILRFKNYIVAMMNKNLLPSKIVMPIIGECVCLSRGLRFNIELILFRGPWSPFENNWHLREEFKRSNKRTELSQKLSRQIAWLAIANFLLCPLIFLWQLMYFFFNYADLIKREPGTLGARCWSQYGTLYLRHFNELDHELNARLNRAYRPAVRYMNSFSSPLMAVIARNIAFICGGVLTTLVLLTIYDEDVVQVEHVITIISALTAIVVISRVFIPDENLIWCPEQLMTAVLAHVHYLPATWRGLAHTNRVREQFGQFFQFRAVYLINELISPLTTPFILMFSFRPRALDVVDFFRNFTVSVVGVGDVCSFAQMDVRKHGNPDWQPTHSNVGGGDGGGGDDDDDGNGGDLPVQTNQYTQGEHGKTELSLVHFTLTNPEWKMPADAKKFVHGIRRHAIQDMDRTRIGAVTNTAMAQSLFSVGSMGGEYSSIIQSIMQTQRLTNSQMGLSLFTSHQPPLPPPPHQGFLSRNPFSPTTQESFVLQQPQHPHQQQQYPDSGRSTLLQNIREDEENIHFNTESTTTTRINNNNNNNSNINESSRRNDSYQSSQIFNNNNNNNINNNMNMSNLAQNMCASVRGGGLRKREGPAEISQDGLLYSMFTGSIGNSGTGAAGRNTSGDVYGALANSLILNESSAASSMPIIELTAADMCLSTLYLHELHHRQIQRRGGQQLSEQQLNRQRQLWQGPHQQPSQQQHQEYYQHNPRSSGGGGGGGGAASSNYSSSSRSSSSSSSGTGGTAGGSNIYNNSHLPTTSSTITSAHQNPERTPLLSQKKT